MFMESLQSVFGKISGLIPLQKGENSPSEGLDFTSIFSRIIAGETGHTEGDSLSPQNLQLHEESGIATLPLTAFQTEGSDMQVSAMMIIRTQDGKEVSLPVTVTVSAEGNIRNLSIDGAADDSFGGLIQLDDFDSQDIEKIAAVLANLQPSNQVQQPVDEGLRIELLHKETDGKQLVIQTNEVDSHISPAAGLVHDTTPENDSQQDVVITQKDVIKVSKHYTDTNKSDVNKNQVEIQQDKTGHDPVRMAANDKMGNTSIEYAVPRKEFAGNGENTAQDSTAFPETTTLNFGKISQPPNETLQTTLIKPTTTSASN